MQQKNEKFSKDGTVHGRRPRGHWPDQGTGQQEQKDEDSASGRSGAIVAMDRSGQFGQNSELEQGVNRHFDQIKPEIPLRQEPQNHCRYDIDAEAPTDIEGEDRKRPKDAPPNKECEKNSLQADTSQQ
jgi:hypothetical protein